MSSFRSALMSWRDRGFEAEHLSDEDKKKVFEVIVTKGRSACQVIVDDVINDIQRIEQRMKDKGAVFYDDNSPTMFDKHLNVINMSECPERWVRVVGRKSLTSLDELEDFLDNIER